MSWTYDGRPCEAYLVHRSTAKWRPQMNTITAAAVAILPQWPQRTVAVLSTVDDGVHAIPVSAPVRAGDRRILLSLHRSRDTLGRIRRWPEAALTFLAEDDLAFTARGRAPGAEEPMAVDPEYVAVAIEVAQVDDHRQPAFRVTTGIDREWVEEAARTRL